MSGPAPSAAASTRGAADTDGTRAPKNLPRRASPAPSEVGARHVRRVVETSDRFFEVEADAIARACRAMARRFRDGGRLLVFAGPGCASDADHVSVEFVHPVIVGKRALPALALPRHAARELPLLASPDDIALAITARGTDPDVLEALRVARELGLLTIGLAGGAGGALADAPLDHRFVVPDPDPTVVQEVQETLYHILWELVHVFFDHEGLL